MKTSLIRFRVTEDEKARIAALAALSSAGSLSDYVRLCALQKKLKSQLDTSAVLALVKINADLARLGNLFRLSLKENNKYDREQIQIIQSMLMENCQAIKARLVKL